MMVSLPALRHAATARNLRLWSGLVLGLFLLLHFADLALGLVSVGAMDAASPWLMAPWRSLPGTVLLLASLLIHFGLALRALYRRRTLTMSFREAAQLGLGLLIPFLLVPHVVGVRIEPQLTGHVPDFSAEVRALWATTPPRAWQQILLLLVVWSHACLGIWFWLRPKVGFVALAPSLLVAALLVPLLALLGFAESSKEVAGAAAPARAAAPASWLPPETASLGIYGFFGIAILGTLAVRMLRLWRGRHARIRISYPDGRTIQVASGSSVLEASRLARVPHASMCGGRGRCSTCRIRVLTGLHEQPLPSIQERATLARFKAAPDIRLACQLRPTRDIAVFPIFATAQAAPSTAAGSAPRAATHERELAILFCDLRGFTRRAEQWLPFDTVFVLNRYFAVVGQAVGEAGGYLDKFIGDGALALFGIETPADVACRQALDAAAKIAQGMEMLNLQLEREQTEPLRIAMGLHAGLAIVGDMGYGQAIGLTAIGDGINVASRLEGAAKELDVEAVISSELASRAGVDISPFPQQRIAVRGREAPVEALVIADAASLAGAIPQSGASLTETRQSRAAT